MLQSQSQSPKLLDQVRTAIRTRHYSIRTEATYLSWIKRFIMFHGKRHPRDMGIQEVQQFLSHLAVEGEVAASTQSQALSAILFLYQQVLKQDIGWLQDVVRAKQPQRLPVVLTQDEVAQVLRRLSGISWIMGTLLYGAGLRLMECLRLRVKDLDFAYNQIVVRDGKGQKDRVTMLPQPVKTPIQQHLQDVQALHARDLEAGAGSVYLPYALERKYPHANRAWVWQYVFPAAKLSRDPRTGMVRRHHTHEQVLQRAVHGAVCQAGIAKPATCHTFRNASTYCYTSLISIDFPLLVRGGWPEIDQRGTQPDSLVLAGQGGRSRGLVTCMLASCPCGIVPSRR